MAEFPALPLWTDALAADTDHLSHEEYGLYQRMLNVAWRLPSCDLPNDAKWIMRRFRLSAVQFDDLCQPIIDEFWRLNGSGRLEQKRLKKEREFVTERSEKQRARAKSRWNKGKAQSRGNAGPHVSGNAPTPTPTPTPIIDSEPNGSSAVARQTEDLKSRIFGPALAWMSEHTGKPERALRSMLGKWCRDHGDGATLEALQAASRAGPIEPVAWITAKLEGTTRQTFGQPFKSSELLERMAEREAGRNCDEGSSRGNGYAVSGALPGPESRTGGGLPGSDNSSLGWLQADGIGDDGGMGEVQNDVDEDDLAEYR